MQSGFIKRMLLAAPNIFNQIPTHGVLKVQYHKSLLKDQTEDGKCSKTLNYDVFGAINIIEDYNNFIHDQRPENEDKKCDMTPVINVSATCGVESSCHVSTMCVVTPPVRDFEEHCPVELALDACGLGAARVDEGVHSC